MRLTRTLISIYVILMLVLTFISLLSTNAFAETNITEITLNTDSSWKVFDAKVNGWTSINFDDSYWQTPNVGGQPIEGMGGALGIDYPEKLTSPPFYFRKTFELSGNEIMSGKLFYASPYWASIYVNDNFVGKNEKLDIGQYLKIGKNVIAVEYPENGKIVLITKIRVVSGPPSPTPTPLVTSTDIAIPTPIPSVQTSKSTSVSLTGEKTDVVLERTLCSNSRL